MNITKLENNVLSEQQQSEKQREILKEMLEKENQDSNEILEGFNFSAYGKVNQMHSGDWQKRQKVLWKNDEKEEINHGR